MLALTAMLLLPLTAQASTVTETLTLSVPNSALNGYHSPYGTVGVQLDTVSHVATFTFTALDSYLFTDGQALDLSLAGRYNAPKSFTTANIAGKSVKLSADGPGTADGFGTFNVRYSAPNSNPSSRFTSATFSVTGDSTWTSLAAIFSATTGIDSQYFAAAHIGVPNSPSNPGGNMFTGYAANGAQIPIPASVLLFASGLLVLAALARRKKAALAVVKGSWGGRPGR